jgi:hypothetical protein
MAKNNNKKITTFGADPKALVGLLNIGSFEDIVSDTDALIIETVGEERVDEIRKEYQERFGGEKDGQWENYEVKPEFRGDETLFIYNSKKHGRTHLCGYPDTQLEASDKPQRVYHGVSTRAIGSRDTNWLQYEALSNEKLDRVLLTRKVQK